MIPRALLQRIASSTILLALLSTTFLSAQIGREYTFSSAPGTYSSITGTQAIAGTTTSTYGAFDQDRSAGPFSIGFDFVFDCKTYTQFTVATSGYLVLGTTNYGTINNNLDGAGAYPIIAPFWESQHMYDGNCSPSISPSIGTYYEVTGTAPNRVLTVEWRTQLTSEGTTYWYGCTGGPLLRYQARLYEGTNRIEFQYGFLYSGLTTSVSIGIAAGSNDFYSVSTGTSATVSSTTANDNINLTSSGIQGGTIYTFTPNRLVLDGRTGAGNEGIVDPEDGDILLSDVNDRIGESNSYTPLDLVRSCASPDLPVEMTISGPDASSYSFAATGTLSYNTSVAGAGVRPAIRFRPLKGGEHSATLSVRNRTTGVTTSFLLLAEAEPRILWSGNPSDGGTANVRNGDTLLKDIQVVFGESRTFLPITLRNVLNPGDAPPAEITYTLIDPSGSYSIDMTSDAIDGGESSNLAITYNAVNGVGTEEAILTVEVDGDRRTYRLRAFAAAPGGNLVIKDETVNENSQLFINQRVCTGDGIFSYEVTANNTGSGDFIVNGFSAFATETEISQGTPPYPILRDGKGDAVAIGDYFLSNAPGVSPRTTANSFSEVIIPEGQSRTFWINFIPEAPGKRFARVYFQTNGFNLNGSTVDGVVTRGLVSANVFGRGLGSTLAMDAAGTRPTSVVFDRTDVRESRTTTAWLYNSGDCDLKIEKAAFSLESGDVDEFELLEVLPNMQLSGGDWVIPPGMGDSIVIRFTPETYGSRLATLRLATNDSTLGGNGVIERGTYYWDIFGVGSIGLETRDLLLGPAVIGAEGSSGSVLMENTSAGVIEIENITITGGNGEILPDPANPWPTLPLVLQPGEKLRLGVVLVPDAAGVPGDRMAKVEVTIKGGDAAIANVSGYAGTRTLAANPKSLFSTTTLGVGEITRAYVGLTNTGTLPVRLTDPTITGTEAANYEITTLRRRVLEPGQTEVVEVTFAPQGVGMSSAALNFGSNATNGAQVVTLGGEGMSTVRFDDPSGSSNHDATPGPPAARLGSNGATRLYTPVPNPANGSITLRYSLATESAASIAIYDATGTLVLEVADLRGAAGEFSEVIDISDLPVGGYFVRMVVNGEMLIEPLNVTR